MWRTMIWIALACVLSSAAAVPHVFWIHEPLGVSHAMYPFRIARPFGVGEIASFPTALINGTAVPTQADIKMRHPDGSVKHAILSFLIPSIDANSTLEVSVIDVSSSTAPEAPLSLADMLSDAWAFEATINITNRDQFFGAASASVSAREILASGAFQYWTRGPIATTIIIADHNGTFDMGWNATVTPLRPMFHVTFWHDLGLIRIRLVGEVSQTMMLFDMQYDIDIYIGRAENTTLVHSQRNMPHFSCARWTKSVWTGPGWLGASSTPSEAINIDYNVAYLIEIGALLNYDISIGSWPVSSISTHWFEWTNGNDTNDLLTLPSFPQFGGIIAGKPVSELGLMMLMAQRGDYRARIIALSLADLFGSFPIAVRESDPRRAFDLLVGNTTSGLGRVVTSWARPQSWLFDYRMIHSDQVYFRYSLDKTLFAANQTAFSWHITDSPEMGYFQYLVTGDYYYLEQLQFAAAYKILANARPDQRGGPAGMASSIEYSSFGIADFCDRLAAASVTPDAMQPERRYFTNATLEFVGFLEASKNISSILDATSVTKRWWTTTYGKRYPENPLGFYSNSPPADVRDNSVSNPNITWTEEEKGGAYGFILALTAAVERGIPEALPMRQYFGAKFLAKQFRELGTYHRHLSLSSTTPAQKLGGAWFKTFTEVMQGYKATFLSKPTFGLDTRSTTAQMTAAAAVSINDEPPYTINVWNWAKRFILPKFSPASFRTGWRYRIVPRILPSWPALCGTPPAPEAECHGPDTWYIFPETGIKPTGGANITVSAISTQSGQTVTMSPADTIFVTGNFTIGCNSTFISQGGQFVINGSSEICGKLGLQATISKPILTSGGCADFARGVLSLNASSIDAPESATRAEVEIARFSCRETESLGGLQFTTSPDDCRKFQFDGNATYTSQSLSVAFQIQPCPSFPLGAVIGGVVGGIVLIAILVVVIYFFHRKRSFNQESVRLKKAASLVT